MRKEAKGRSAQAKLVLGVKLMVAVELAAVFGSYYIWRKMNRSQDFRHSMHQRFPLVLEGYYKIGERLGSLPTREMDSRKWGLDRE